MTLAIKIAAGHDRAVGPKLLYYSHIISSHFADFFAAFPYCDEKIARNASFITIFAIEVSDIIFHVTGSVPIFQTKLHYIETGFTGSCL